MVYIIRDVDLYVLKFIISLIYNGDVATIYIWSCTHLLFSLNRVKLEKVDYLHSQNYHTFKIFSYFRYLLETLRLILLSNIQLTQCYICLKA